MKTDQNYITNQNINQNHFTKEDLGFSISTSMVKNGL